VGLQQSGEHPAKYLAYEAQYHGLIVKENYYRMWLKGEFKPLPINKFAGMPETLALHFLTVKSNFYMGA